MSPSLGKKMTIQANWYNTLNCQKEKISKHWSPESLCNLPEVTQLLNGQACDLGLCLADSMYCTSTACTILDTFPSQGNEDTKVQSQKNKAKPMLPAPGGSCCSILIWRCPGPDTSYAPNVVSPLLLKLFMVSFTYLLPNFRFFCQEYREDKTTKYPQLQCKIWTTLSFSSGFQPLP